MQVTFSVTNLEDSDHIIQWFTVSLSDELVQLPALTLHRAIKSEVDVALRDLSPYIVEAVYRELGRA